MHATGLFGGLPVVLQTALLLAVSNVFMTFVGYTGRTLAEYPKTHF